MLAGVIIVGQLYRQADHKMTFFLGQKNNIVEQTFGI